MAKTQLNFRIEEELLKAIKKEANRQGKNHTQWIIEQCQKALDRHPLTLEELSDRLTHLESQVNTFLGQNLDQKNQIETKLTHAELARQLGVSSSTVSRWGTGKRKPPEDLKYKFDQTNKRWVKHEI
jgi:transcriptional regulator with XRE-family HTH domain